VVVLPLLVAIDVINFGRNGQLFQSAVSWLASSISPRGKSGKKPFPHRVLHTCFRLTSVSPTSCASMHSKDLYTSIETV
jgi:hypothetical protein